MRFHLRDLPMRPLRPALLITMMGVACVGKSDPSSHIEKAPEGASEAAKPTAAVVAPKRPEFVHAPAGSAADAVKSAIAAAGNGHKVLVYVGAEWCEPCTAFHRSVEAGELDEQLAGVRFVEFDSDHDRERLAAGGYDGKLIPRFVLPTPDGEPSEHRIEGGIKGAGAVEHIMARLAPLLARG